MLDGLICILIKLINFFTQSMFGWWIDMLIFFIEFLPPSPFQFNPIKWGAVGQSVGYFIPISDMILDLARIIGALVVWYSVQHVLRLLRAIR